MARVTAQQVAESAGVSISAVSRTFTQGGSVSPDTRARVEAAAAKLGYRPNQLARGLMTGRTRLVGVLIASGAGSAGSQALTALVEGLQAHSLHPLVAHIDAAPGPAAAIDMLMQYQVDAAFIIGDGLPDGFTRDCQRAGMPALHLLGRKAARATVPIVGADESAAAAALVEKLAAGKRKRIACITDTPDAERVTAFAEAAAGIKGMTSSVLTVEAATAEAGAAAAGKLLAGGRAPQALFCTDDRLALGALAACREAGLDVPGSIAVIGWGALGLDPALATVRVPVAEIVDDAVTRLAAALATGGGKLAGKRLQCELLPGATLG